MTEPRRLERLRGDLLARGQEAWRFVLYLGERLTRDNCLQNAATLSYTTLLSIVPLLAVAFSVLAAFPVFEPFNEKIRQFVFGNLVPTSGDVVRAYLERFAGKAAGLTAAGIAGLVVSAVLMMSAVDKALNDIWHVHQRRSPLQGFMIYWTVLTLGPLLVGLSLGMTSYLESLQVLAPWAVTLPKQTLFAVMPFLAEVLAFLFLYAAVPNRRVPLRHAALGAVLGAGLFEVAKSGFAWFITSVPTYQVIYGALAALPVFLLWVYLSWVVVLLGAEFTQALSGYRVGRAGALSDPRWKLVLAVRVIGHLARAQGRGRTLSRSALATLEPRAGEQALLDCLQSLQRARVVLRTERGGYALARDLGEFTLLDLYRSQPFVLPEGGPKWRGADTCDERLGEIFTSTAGVLHEQLNVPLARFFADGEPAGKQGQ